MTKVRVTKLAGLGLGQGHDAEGNVVQMAPQYTIAGELLKPVIAGGTIEVARTERNGLNIPGHFETTAVVGIDDKGEHKILYYTTQSGSVYRVEYLK